MIPSASSFHSFSLIHTESIPFFSFQGRSFKIDNIYHITHENQDSYAIDRGPVV